MNLLPSVCFSLHLDDFFFSTSLNLKPRLDSPNFWPSAATKYQKLIELMLRSLVSPFQVSLPWVFPPWFRIVPGATPAPADRVPHRSWQLPRMKRRLRADTQWQELMCPSLLSFPALHHWFVSGVTLVTRSFNLLQRPWPTEHISWGWEQTLSDGGPNGSHHFFPDAWSTVTGSGACFAFTRQSRRNTIKKIAQKQVAESTRLHRGGYY